MKNHREHEIPKIIYNAIRTPDGTVLVSRHWHDYVSHKDLNGTTYAVDGGLEYLRRTGGEDYEELSLYKEDKFEKIRKAFTWGTYGEEHNEKFRWVLLCDMSDNHIINILTEVSISPLYEWLFITELGHRNEEEAKKRAENE